MKDVSQKVLSISVVATLSLLLVACGDGGSESTSSNPSTNTTSLNITDSILTKRSANCEDYINVYSANVRDIQENVDFTGSLEIELSNGKCSFTANSIPNHNFNDDSAAFHEKVQENSINVEITANPSFAASTTSLSLADNAIYLNGVKLNILSAGCYGVDDGKIGCHDIDTPFRYDPMYDDGSGAGFGVDMHNAHTQPGGLYHYHASPVALFNTDGGIESPVIGFASDGFPIFGTFFDDNGTVRAATSSYVLKSGTRDAVTYGGVTYNPGDSYDGEYTSDWEYQEGAGDLDECNGMTLDGVYGYYVTTTYPWVINCYKGTPDSSFGR